MEECMTQAAVRKAIIALIEKNYPKITITQGTGGCVATF
jgi:hypothetical protein